MQELRNLKIAVDNTSEHIVITDPDGVIVYANKAASKITGFSKKEMIGKKAGSKALWGGLMDKRFYQNLWKKIKTEKKTFIGEIINHRKNGEKYNAAINITPILDKRGRVEYFVGIERNITQSAKLGMIKDEFIHIVSHQFRTPLSTAKWYLELLAASGLNKEQQKNLKIAADSNRRMIELVDSLLELSHIEYGEMTSEAEPTSVSELINEIVKGFDDQIKEKRIRISHKITKGMPLLNLDQRLVREIYHNLIGNAVKYSKSGGQITISARIRNRLLTSEIVDNGIGIPCKDSDLVFSKFFRSSNAKKADSEGSGLGLYITKRITEFLGGEIGISCGRKGGTVVRFTLPMEGKKIQKKT